MLLSLTVYLKKVFKGRFTVLRTLSRNIKRTYFFKYRQNLYIFYFYMITCSNFLINELDLQIEDLFMYFTVRQLQFLSPAYHVAEISHLRRNNRRLNRQ